MVDPSITAPSSIEKTSRRLSVDGLSRSGHLSTHGPLIDPRSTSYDAVTNVRVNMNVHSYLEAARSLAIDPPGPPDAQPASRRGPPPEPPKDSDLALVMLERQIARQMAEMRPNT